MPKAEPRIQKSFGERVRTLRILKGFTQESLAHESGLDRSYIGQVERGARNISLANIEAIARALNLPISELMQGVDVYQKQ